MHRNTLAVLVVAALLALAGCGGQSATGTTTAPGADVTPTPTAAPTSQTPTTSASTSSAPSTSTAPTTTAAPVDGVAFPDGFSRDGFPKSTGTIAAHHRAMANTSYTVTYQRGNASSAGTMTLNHSERRAHLDYTVSGTPIQIYVHNGTDYRRMTKNGSTTYDALNLSLSQVRRGLALPALRMFSLGNYSYEGTSTHAGVDVHTYRVTEIDASSKYDPENFSEVEGYLRIDPEGRILDYRWNATYRGQALAYRYTITELRTATVDRPDWVNEAAS